VVSENKTSKALLHKQANSKTTINKTLWYACYVQRLHRDEKHPNQIEAVLTFTAELITYSNGTSFLQQKGSKAKGSI